MSACGAMALLLSACSPTGVLDWDLRGRDQGSTAEAAQRATAPRPSPDSRGVLSYPGYQVAMSRRGDTVASVASRVGLTPEELARANALQPGDSLRAGEILALPRRVAEAPAAEGATAAPGAVIGGPIDVTTIAGAAIDRAAPAAAPAAPAPAAGPEPRRHRVARGETAYSVARLYGVSARALADWNGLGPDLALREGQTLLIPTAAAAPAPAATADASAPGAGSATPTPPSAAQPLPAERPTAAAAKPPETPPSPGLGATRTPASAARMAMPAEGRIIRPYAKGRNDGIDIAAAAGSPVRAAADGTVAAITKDTDQVPIVVIRHEGNLLTVYAGIDALSVTRGATVKRGQQIAVIRRADPAFLHFEVRRGADSVDPVEFLQ
ncbi:MAG: peptidoglycan DD-metalloendopeptidase family protein [Paracoccaceae bacterium]|nr:MAG: peptidoglycan DD-metalloendopeptidase family protein [Paracoccaceae bacterium]